MLISPCRQATLAILHARPASPKSRLLLRVGFSFLPMCLGDLDSLVCTFCFWSALHCHKGTLAILLPSPASHEGTLAILRFQEDLGDLGTKYDGGLHARPPRFRGTQGTLAILGPRGHSSGPIRKQRKFPDFKVARSSGAIFWTEFDVVLCFLYLCSLMPTFLFAPTVRVAICRFPLPSYFWKS